MNKRIRLFVFVFACLVISVSAQIGSSWTQYFPTWTYHVPPNADNYGERYTYKDGVFHLWVKNTDLSSFPGEDSGPRSEVRVKNEYKSGNRQFEADMMVMSGADKVGIWQVFQRPYPWMIRVYGTKFYQYGNGSSFASVPFGTYQRFNTIHYSSSRNLEIYLNGKQVLNTTISASDGSVDWYNKFGVYGRDGMGALNEIYFKNVKYFSGGNSTISQNQPPSVSITSPQNNASFESPATVTISASASDADGSVSKVEFYNGSTLLGTELSSPYSITWNNVAAGTYTITVKATDDKGASATSSAVQISVVQPISKSIPGKIEAEEYSSMSGVQTQTTTDIGGGLNVGWVDNGDWMDYAVNVNASGSYKVNFRVASNTSGGKIELKRGTSTLGYVNVTNTGGWQSWKTISTTVALSSGTQSLRLAFSGGSGGLMNVNWFEFIAANQPPSVSITSPQNNASFLAPAGVTISATASDADGSISKVEFYNGSTVLGTDTSSPYSLTWSGVAAGSYSLTAKAVDNSGANTISSAVSITVMEPVAPSGGGTLTVHARGTCGSEQMQLLIDEVIVKTWDNVGTSLADYKLSGLSGTSNVKIRFSNDGKIDGCDRNLFVDYIVVGDTTFQAESQSTNTGVWTGTTCGGKPSEWLHCGGYIDFGTRDCGGTAHQDIPGKIEAEEYSDMYGIQTESTTDAGGGLNVGWISSGDWMDYQVNVFASGTYKVNFRVATTKNNSKIELKKGTTVLGYINVGSTGGWETWKTVSTSVQLSSGIQTLRLAFSGGSGNLMNVNWFEFVSGVNLDMFTGVLTPFAGPGTLAIKAAAMQGKVQFHVSLPRSGAFKMEVYDIKGRQLFRHSRTNASSGTHTVMWNGEIGNNYNSKTLFVKLHFNGENVIQKVNLLK